MRFLKYHIFLLTKLPAAYFCGARIKSINSNECNVKITLNWFNKNPYRSMFWADEKYQLTLGHGPRRQSQRRITNSIN